MSEIYQVNFQTLIILPPVLLEVLTVDHVATSTLATSSNASLPQPNPWTSCEWLLLCTAFYSHYGYVDSTSQTCNEMSCANNPSI